MKAVILAAGKGTRLHPLTINTPKSLLEISGKTILDNIIENLPDEITEVIVVTKHLEEKIVSHIEKRTGRGANTKKVRTMSQGEHTGTFGALLTLKNVFSKNERFLVLNGDDLHNKEELVKFLDYPLAMGAQKNIMPAYYTLEIGEDGVLERFRSQTETEKETGTLIATGVYLLDSNVFNFNPVKINDGELGLPQTLIQNSYTYPLHVVETKKWRPINTLRDLESANLKT